MGKRARNILIVAVLAVMAACGTARRTDRDWQTACPDGGVLKEMYDREVTRGQIDSIMAADTIPFDMDAWPKASFGPDNLGDRHTEYTYVKDRRSMDTYVVRESGGKYRITLRKIVFE